MTGNCSKCKKEFNLDNFIEDGIPVLWYCHCGTVIVRTPFGFAEIPKEKVDLGEFPAYGLRTPEPGRFIIIFRWKLIQEKMGKFISQIIKEHVKE